MGGNISCGGDWCTRGIEECYSFNQGPINENKKEEGTPVIQSTREREDMKSSIYSSRNNLNN